MRLLLRQLIITLVLTLVAACDLDKANNDELASNQNNTIIKDTSANHSASSSKANWRNPVLTPMGANIVRVIHGT